VAFEILSASPHGVDVRLRLHDDLLDAEKLIDESLVCDIATRAIRHGLSLSAEAATTRTRLEDASAHHFPQSGGEWLFVHASLLHDSAEKAAWSAQVHRTTANGDTSRANLVGTFVQSFRRSVGAALAENGNGSTAAIAHGQNGSGDRAAAETFSPSADARRDQLFRAACDVISRKGYAATTVRDIAVASGLPISTMYQYIKSKEDLLFAITNECMQELFDYFEEHQQVRGSAKEKMRNAIARYVQYTSKNRKYINLVYRETKSLSARNRQKIFDLERRLLGSWEKIIVDGKKAGEFSVNDPFLAANCIYFLCTIWALRHWIIGRHSEGDVTAMLTKFCLRGLE